MGPNHFAGMITLQGTNISPKNGILKMIFLFPRWDMLIPWRVNGTQSFWGNHYPTQMYGKFEGFSMIFLYSAVLRDFPQRVSWFQIRNIFSIFTLKIGEALPI